MVKLSPNPNPKDTLAAFRKIEDIRLKINSGIASFEELAEKVSEDPSAKFNKEILDILTPLKWYILLNVQLTIHQLEKFLRLSDQNMVIT